MTHPVAALAAAALVVAGPPVGSHDTFRVMGDGRAASIVEAVGGTHLHLAGVRLPYTRSVSPSEPIYELRARAAAGTHRITCTILDEAGRVLVRRTASGPHPVVDCTVLRFGAQHPSVL